MRHRFAPAAALLVVVTGVLTGCCYSPDLCGPPNIGGCIVQQASAQVRATTPASAPVLPAAAPASMRH